jgi:CheY-like chemotaxis protein
MATKVMLIEDDTNLSEIYQARLEAEGFEIVSAKDGEEALALAVNERPDLIICDVMMPRISGFDMLDILRGTSGIQDTKVIMMTALSQAEDKERAEKLGANRYLVKSQVTLEDVVKTVHEVLGDMPVDTPPPSFDTPLKAPYTPLTTLPVKEPTPTEPPVATEPPPEPVTADSSDLMNDQTTTTEQTAVESQIENFVEADKNDQTDNSPSDEPTETPGNTGDSGHSTDRVIEPEVHPAQTEDSKSPSTEPSLDDKTTEPEQSPVSTDNPTKNTGTELDPNQIAL